MTLFELLTRLEERLGSHQLPLNRAASGMRDLLDGSALHHELVRRIVRVLHDANHCRALTDPIDPQTTIDALGPIRHDIQQSVSTDIDAFRMVDDLCRAVCETFAEQLPERQAIDRAQAAGGGEVIALDPLRRTRRFTRSA